MRPLIKAGGGGVFLLPVLELVSSFLKTRRWTQESHLLQEITQPQGFREQMRNKFCIILELDLSQLTDVNFGLAL